MKSIESISRSNVSHMSFFLLDDYGDDKTTMKKVVTVDDGSSEHYDDEDYESSVMKMFAGVEGDANGSWTASGGLGIGGSTEAWDQATSEGEGKLQCREYNWPVLFLFTIVILAIGNERFNIRL